MPSITHQAMPKPTTIPPRRRSPLQYHRTNHQSTNLQAQFEVTKSSNHSHSSSASHTHNLTVSFTKSQPVHGQNREERREPIPGYINQSPAEHRKRRRRRSLSSRPLPSRDCPTSPARSAQPRSRRLLPNAAVSQLTVAGAVKSFMASLLGLWQDRKNEGNQRKTGKKMKLK
jgi:hypothetical protein